MQCGFQPELKFWIIAVLSKRSQRGLFVWMCASFESLGKQFRPGRIVSAWVGQRVESAVWSGFARSEILPWWLGKGCRKVDIPASRFAERSRHDGRMHWADISAGLVIRGLWDSGEEAKDSGGTVPRLWIVTRQSSPVEKETFGHERMPLLEAPLFSADPIEPVIDLAPPSPQMELF